MNFKNLSRTEKEKLYIRKMTELQRLWENPIDEDWQFVNDGTDEQMDKMLTDVMGQLRFEKSSAYIKKSIVFIVYVFIILGVIGLLVFGIKQIF